MKIVIVGGVAGGATAAARILTGSGHDCYNISGGYRFYETVRNDLCLTERAAHCGMDLF